jgi:shikimate kinase
LPEQYDKLHKERMPLYKKLADFIVNNDGNAEETVLLLMKGIVDIITILPDN